MPNPTLHGNHQPCPDCSGSGDGAVMFSAGEFEGANGQRFPKANVYGLCKKCRGRGFVGKPPLDIMAMRTHAARLNYWPEFERRIGTP
jgi:hypothetical protein